MQALQFFAIQYLYLLIEFCSLYEFINIDVSGGELSSVFI